MELSTKRPVPLTLEAQRQSESVWRCIVGRQNPRRVQEFQISVKAEHEGIPLGVVCPTHISIQRQFGVNIDTDTGLEMLWVDQIHADITRFPGCPRRQAQDGRGNSPQYRTVN